MSYTKGDLNVTYKYDADGLRTQKTVNGVQHDYYYVDGRIAYEKVGNEYSLYYRYDQDGRLSMVIKNRLSDNYKWYFYLLSNSRGDIIGMNDAAGPLTVRYNYDAWGKVLSVTNAAGTQHTAGNFAHQISVRYRGYYYDEETELYYLQSRYYDPETGRFLNADSVDFIGYSGENLSYNAFAYCENNSVNCVDASGNSFVKYACNLVTKASVTQSIKDRVNIFTPKKGKKKSGVINVLIDKDYIDPKTDELNPTILIYDSYKITDKEQMNYILEFIMNSKYFDSNVFTRSKYSFYVEWYGHNFMYQLSSILMVTGINIFIGWNNSAKDVNLDENENMVPWYFIYYICAYNENKNQEEYI